MGTYLDQDRIQAWKAQGGEGMGKLESLDSAIVAWNEEGEKREWSDWQNPDYVPPKGHY
jgi:hypothetical protein